MDWIFIKKKENDMYLDIYLNRVILETRNSIAKTLIRFAASRSYA